MFAPSHRSLSVLLLCACSGMALAGPTFPQRKPGLWEMRTSETPRGTQPMVIQQCGDAATDKALQEYGMSQPKMNRKFCKEETRNEAGKMLVYTEVCKQSETTMTRRTVISGDFDVAYKIQTHTRYEPVPKTPPPNDDMVADMRWLGACPAGMKPGDISMPGGMKMNVMDMTRMGTMARQVTRTGPDARPGEMTLPDGTKVDMEALQRMANEMQKQVPQGARGTGK